MVPKAINFGNPDFLHPLVVGSLGVNRLGHFGNMFQGTNHMTLQSPREKAGRNHCQGKRR